MKKYISLFVFVLLGSSVLGQLKQDEVGALTGVSVITSAYPDYTIRASFVSSNGYLIANIDPSTDSIYVAFENSLTTPKSVAVLKVTAISVVAGQQADFTCESARGSNITSFPATGILFKSDANENDLALLDGGISENLKMNMINHNLLLLDSLIASSTDSTSAGNLLTETANEIDLGGTADQNTTLDIGVYNFNLSRSIGNFNVYGNDGTNYGSFGSSGNNTQIIHYNTAATHGSKFRIDKDSAIIAWTLPTTSRFKLTPDTLFWNDAIKFEDYGSGTITGTETYLAAFDADGDLIEVDPSTVGSSGSGTTNYLTKWTGANSQGNSVIYDNGTNVGIGTTTTGAILTIGSSSPAISTDTNNASDTKSLILTGGGDASISRGGVINLFGNEHATNPGNIHITGGDVNGAINFYTDPYTSPTATFAGSSVGINQTAPAAKLHIVGDGSGTNKLIFGENSLGDDVFVLKENGELQLDQYGSGSITGTETYELAVDASGNVIEQAITKEIARVFVHPDSSLTASTFSDIELTIPAYLNGAELVGFYAAVNSASDADFSMNLNVDPVASGAVNLASMTMTASSTTANQTLTRTCTTGDVIRVYVGAISGSTPAGLEGYFVFEK